jgi:NADPH:quinone reductase
VKAIRVHAYGGPEVLRLDELPDPDPRSGELLIEVAAAGVNLFDTQLRTGLYKLWDLPLTLGLEGAGVVKRVGVDVQDFAAGDRVAFIHGPGAYATQTVVQAERTIRLPDQLEFEKAAAVLFQGLTAHYLTTSTFPLRDGSNCLIYSAAGGVGTLLCQIAKHRGATVIGAVSSSEKVKAARDAGADHVVVYRENDIVAAVKDLTKGEGVDVAYDAVGLETYRWSMDALRPRGMLVLYGEASGLVPPIDPHELLFRNSLFLTRTGLDHHIADRRELMKRTDEIFSWVLQGKLEQKIHERFPLMAAAEAHRAIESRATTGKLLLIP